MKRTNRKPPHMQGDLAQITALIEPELRQQLDEVAIREDRTIASVVRRALREYLGRQGAAA